MARSSCLLLLLTVTPLFISSCSSGKAGSDPAAALATTSAVVVGGALAPIGQAIRSITESDHERRLSFAAVYNLGGGVVAIANQSGWFTDRSESATPGQQNQSAWVIDLQREPRDLKDVIVLSDKNLNRWFFRDHDHAALRLIPYEGPYAHINVTTGDRVQMGKPTDHFTLILDGKAYSVALSQDATDIPPPTATGR